MKQLAEQDLDIVEVLIRTVRAFLEKPGPEARHQGFGRR